MPSEAAQEFRSMMDIQKGQSTEPEKPHISSSQINLILDCSAKYMFRYIFRIRPPSRPFAARGKAVHRGLEYNYRQKIETHEDLPLSDVLEVASDAFDSMLAYVQWDSEEDPGQFKDQTVELISFYHQLVAPTIQPVMVEQPVIIDIPETDFIIKGFIDLIDSNGYIRDTKTKNITPPQKVVDNSLQLTIYAMGYRQLTGKAEAGVILDNVVNLKKGPKYVPLVSQRTDRDITRITNIARAIVGCIKSGSYCPNPNSMMCSESQCEFWKICHETF
ncbi:MAG TPA: hypothetical protein DD734_03460 [Firmicutes bacterium]|nr:hypothetical protein [Bacillota bacterium]